jgi:hypothetical protein
MNVMPAMIVFVLVASAVAAAQTKPTSAPVWQTTPDGQFILRPFEHAPYPHKSREDGHKYGTKMFPRDPNYVDSTVGIVIPAGYQPGDSVDYIVHFHGWDNHVSKVIKQYKLMEQLNTSKVNAILLVPQGPKDAQDSGGGKLENDPGAFAKLIAEVTAYLNAEGKIHTTNVGKIALTAHSGGYQVTAAITHLGGMNDHITDVLLLDASYGSLPWFVDWCKADSSHRLVSLFTDHLAKANTELMGLLDQAHVEHLMLQEGELKDVQFEPRHPIFMHTKGPHDQVPVDYFGRLIATSALARDKNHP